MPPSSTKAREKQMATALVIALMLLGGPLCIWATAQVIVGHWSLEVGGPTSALLWIMEILWILHVRDPSF